MASSLYSLADLKTAVYARLENNTLFWTEQEVTDVINEAMRVSNLYCGWYQGVSNMLSVANSLIYAVPTGILFPTRVECEGVQLDPIPVSQIGQDYRNWTTDTTARLGPVARWVPIGIDRFCLHPLPATGGMSISVTGVMETPLLVNDDDVMQLDDQYANIIIDYGAEVLPLKEAGSVFQAASKNRIGFLRTMKSLTMYRKVVMPRWFVQAGAPVAEGQVK